MRVYKVMFINQGKVYELYAKAVHQGELYGFVEIEGLLFGEASSLLIDPAEERLQNEFRGVNRSLIPIQAVIRIDEVEKGGQSKIHEATDTSNITPFPATLLSPDKGPEKK
jgi:hypothetical protein